MVYNDTLVSGWLINYNAFLILKKDTFTILCRL